MAPVKTDRGMEIVPTVTFADCPQLDVVMVPGGPGQQDLMEDAVVLEFLQRQARGAKYVTSVCTGSLVLGAAGLLKGKRATSHWAAIDHLGLLGAIPVSEKVVIDGNVITGAGVDLGHRFRARSCRHPGRRGGGARRSSCRSSTIRRRRSIPARPRPRAPDDAGALRSTRGSAQRAAPRGGAACRAQARRAAASKEQGRMPLPTKLDHCVIHVSDWERSNAFYRDVMGAELVQRDGRLGLPVRRQAAQRARRRRAARPRWRGCRCSPATAICASNGWGRSRTPSRI